MPSLGLRDRRAEREELHIVTATLGLLLAVLVTAVSVQDSVAGTQLFDQVAARKPGTRGFTPIPKRWAVDGGRTAG